MNDVPKSYAITVVDGELHIEILVKDKKKDRLSAYSAALNEEKKKGEEKDV